MIELNGPPRKGGGMKSVKRRGKLALVAQGGTQGEYKKGR
jgi:hypothetical protein